MRIKIIAYTICIIVLTLIQSSMLDYVKVYGVKPNLLVVFIVCTALITNNVQGAIVGFFCGITHDIVSGKVIGLYTLLGLYLGFIIGSLNKRLYRENIFVIILFNFVATIVYQFTIFLLYSFTKGTFEIVFSFKYIILPEAIYNSFVSIFICIIVIKLNLWFEDRKRLARRY